MLKYIEHTQITSVYLLNRCFSCLTVQVSDDDFDEHHAFTLEEPVDDLSHIPEYIERFILGDNLENNIYIPDYNEPLIDIIPKNYGKTEPFNNIIHCDMVLDDDSDDSDSSFNTDDLSETDEESWTDQSSEDESSDDSEEECIEGECSMDDESSEEEESGEEESSEEEEEEEEESSEEEEESSEEEEESSEEEEESSEEEEEESSEEEEESSEEESSEEESSEEEEGSFISDTLSNDSNIYEISCESAINILQRNFDNVNDALIRLDELIASLEVITNIDNKVEDELLINLDDIEDIYTKLDITEPLFSEYIPVKEYNEITDTIILDYVLDRIRRTREDVVKDILDEK